MHAQYYLKQFYSLLGFAAEGRPFQEARMKHIQMVRAL
jgi:predicted GNAT family N-acyltransferase